MQLKYLKPKDSKSKNQVSLDKQKSKDSSTGIPISSTELKPKLMLILKWGGELTTAGMLNYYLNKFYI